MMSVIGSAMSKEHSFLSLSGRSIGSVDLVFFTDLILLHTWKMLYNGTVGGGPGEGGDQRGRLQRLSTGSGGNHFEESYIVAASLRIFKNVDSPYNFSPQECAGNTKSWGDPLRSGELM